MDETCQKTYGHMDVPWWIGHDDMEFTKRRIVKGTEIAVDPLWRKLP